MKSSTCVDGGLLVFCLRARNMSLPRPDTWRSRIAEGWREEGGREGEREGEGEREREGGMYNVYTTELRVKKGGRWEIEEGDERKKKVTFSQSLLSLRTTQYKLPLPGKINK